MSNHKWPHSPQPQQAGRIQRLSVRSAHFFHTFFVPSLPLLSNSAENHWAVSGQIVPGMAYLHCPCRDKLYRKRPTFIVRGRTNCTGNVQYVLPSLSVSGQIVPEISDLHCRVASLFSFHNKSVEGGRVASFLPFIYICGRGQGGKFFLHVIIYLWRGIGQQFFLPVIMIIYLWRGQGGKVFTFHNISVEGVGW